MPKENPTFRDLFDVIQKLGDGEHVIHDCEFYQCIWDVKMGLPTRRPSVRIRYEFKPTEDRGAVTEYHCIIIFIDEIVCVHKCSNDGNMDAVYWDSVQIDKSIASASTFEWEDGYITKQELIIYLNDFLYGRKGDDAHGKTEKRGDQFQDGGDQKDP